MEEEQDPPSIGKGRFTRVIEDFNCSECGTFVRGKGYTDHCPNCLWGKHVDIMPGDRTSTCKGKLEPTSAFHAKGAYTIVYRCQKCGVRKNFKESGQDNRELLLLLASKNPHS